MPELEVNAIAALLSDFTTKIKDLEERHTLLKEKVLLLSQTFLKQQDRFNKEIGMIKDEVRESKIELDRVKEGLQHIIRESTDFVRREELKTFERYVKIFEPLKFVRVEEVKEIVARALEEREKKQIK